MKGIVAEQEFRSNIDYRDNGYLPKLRSALPAEEKWEDVNRSLLNVVDKSQMSLTCLMETDMLDATDYTQGDSGETQDESTRVMCNLYIRVEKSNRAMIPNLFGSHASQTINILVNMLECHKLRSPHDFEIALARDR